VWRWGTGRARACAAGRRTASGDAEGSSDLAAATVREEKGLTVVGPVEVARDRGLEPDFVAAWLTLQAHSALEAVALTAAVAGVLADEGIPCSVIAGYHHDHLLVPADRAESAIVAIEAPASTSAG
jgi:hypothetical protein